MSQEFHLEEYRALRDETLELIRQISSVNRFFLISTALSVAWLLSEAGKLDPITSFIGAWIPYFIAQWFGAYRKDISESLNRIDSYIRKLEEIYAKPGIGWSTTIHHRRKDNISFGRTRDIHRLVSISMLIFAFYYCVRHALNLHFWGLF